MRSFTSFFAALAILTPRTFAAPPLINIKRAPEGQAVTDRYIVKLKDDASRSSHLRWVNRVAASDSTAAGTITPDSENWTIINGYAGVFTDDALLALRANRDVEYIVEDTIASFMDVVEQKDAPWGLERLSNTPKLSGQDPTSMNYTYQYDDSAGAGVDVYIIDSGINTSHEDFGGRARWGKTFGEYADKDGNGHGTHCAGIATGRRWGVAKRANVIAVKVMSDGGSGSFSDIISGIDWVVAQAKETGNPSVASLSLGGIANQALDDVVNRAVDAGVHVAVAAGNSNTDASFFSPGRAEKVCTVGAMDITDTRASFSNFGASVDIFAPGVGIVSTWKDNNTATNTMSGTSMAAPHIAGLMAYLIASDTDGRNYTPKALIERIQNLGTDCILKGVPPNTRNDLARSSIGASTTDSSLQSPTSNPLTCTVKAETGVGL